MSSKLRVDETILDEPYHPEIHRLIKLITRIGANNLSRFSDDGSVVEIPLGDDYAVIDVPYEGKYVGTCLSPEHLIKVFPDGKIVPVKNPYITARVSKEAGASQVFVLDVNPEKRHANVLVQLRMTPPDHWKLLMYFPSLNDVWQFSLVEKGSLEKVLRHHTADVFKIDVKTNTSEKMV